jgi:hypothetical protein
MPSQDRWPEEQAHWTGVSHGLLADSLLRCGSMSVKGRYQTLSQQPAPTAFSMSVFGHWQTFATKERPGTRPGLSLPGAAFQAPVLHLTKPSPAT